MNNRTTLAELRAMDAAEAARLPPAHLALLLEDAAALRADAKHVSDLLSDALHRRYGAIATELRVPEARFAAWPPRMRALFEPARTVGAGRPTYTLAPKDPA